MINFLSNWIEQIALSVIIVSIFELILPEGKLKKYIKVILGIYIIFCIISPFVNNSELYDIGNISLEQYIQNATKNENSINQESMDLRLQNLYIEELKRDITEKVKEKGYIVSKCNIDAKLSKDDENPGIHNISLILTNKTISNVEKVEIMSNKNEEQDNIECEKIKEDLSKYYEIDKNLINIKIK